MKPTSHSRDQQVGEMLDKGITPALIARSLGIRIQYVYIIRKRTGRKAPATVKWDGKPATSLFNRLLCTNEFITARVGSEGLQSGRQYWLW